MPRPAHPQMPPDLCQSEPVRDWQGQWLWCEPVAKDRNVYALFRRSFVAAHAGTLRLRLTADSWYMLYVDGEFVARGPARAPLAYYLFDSYELAVAAGAHVLAVLVHHVGQINATMMLGRPGLLVDAEFCSADAGRMNLAGPEQWRCRKCDAWRQDLGEMMSHFGFWEECDLRKFPAQWTTVDFDDSAWADPVALGKAGMEPWTRLLPRDIEMLQYTTLADPKVASAGKFTPGSPAERPSLEVSAQARQPTDELPEFAIEAGKSGDGFYVTVDFGRTVSGYFRLRLTAEGAAGRQLDISGDEVLTVAGTVNPERTYAHLTDRYWLKDGPQTVGPVQPRGFRYVTIDLAPGVGKVVLERVSALEETYPFRAQPVFECDDAELNNFFHKAVETLRLSTSDAYLDNPGRERVQWTEDMFMHARVAAMACGHTAMTRHALFQGAQTQLPDGRINGFFPSERDNCAFAASSLMWVNMCVEYWLHTGVEDDIRRLLPAVTRVLGVLIEHENDQGLIASWPVGQFWEWSPIETSGCLLLTNGFYAFTLERLAQHEIFAPALPDDWADKVARIRRNGHRLFFDEERGAYRDGIRPDGAPSPVYSQAANLSAILAGICPEHQRAELVKLITDPDELGPVPAGEPHLSESNVYAGKRLVPVGTPWFGHWLCEAIYEAGMPAVALAQMRHIWGDFDDLALFPEVRILGGNTFLCQGWASGPAYLLPARVLGIRPWRGGWREVDFAPAAVGLNYAKGMFSTPLGKLRAAWQKRPDGSLELELAAPAGMTVHVHYGDAAHTVIGPCQWQHCLS